MHTRRTGINALLAAGLLGLWGLSSPALAQSGEASYPTKPVRIIVGFSPGGGSDTVARLLAEPLAKILGQSFVVENRPGAGGQLGRTLLAESEADGYTLLFDSASFTASAVLAPDLKYDAVKDITGVAQIASTPVVMVANNDLPAKDIKSLIALAKQKPGELGYATSGVGSLLHFSGELLNSMAGIKLQHVPYKGAEGMPDVIAGRVQLAFAGVPQTLQLIKSGQMRAMAVTTTERLESLPDVPTMAEAGVPGYEVNNWYGIFAPAGTPKPIIDKLNAAVGETLKDKGLQDQLTAQGMTASAKSAEDFTSYVAAEIEKWERVAKTAGITAN
ncbi:MFS transporter [Agaricicola taiwanensis]|uniref:MFS transporter n=1 Tax=Agaricicola taiwanensis TaxID=591372 RepID=A0A8J2YLJ4_9RHOB|nr:tripartite tricarboxylate transporter substrate binding protein [Agaricicola taiwanensis]GGE52569.1 MFS transporter [Agaricicola taiwanensis]